MQRKSERPRELDHHHRPTFSRAEGLGLAAVIALVIALACVFALVRSAESPARTPSTTVARIGK